ncbi:MAG TPA: hypothetical protein VGL65_00120, partial [Gemmatimonadales bacterium]
MVKPGTRVGAGDKVAVIHGRTDADVTAATHAAASAIHIGDTSPELLPLIAWRVTGDGTTPYGGER